MSITTYTTYNEIRAVLGVSDADIEDSTLALAIYSNLLNSDLESINSNFISLHQTIAGEASQTDAQQRFLRNTSSFATFSVAKSLLAAMPMFAVEKMSDSKATGERFDEAQKDTAKRIEAMYDSSRAALIASVGEVGSSATTTRTFSLFAVSSPATDPVTGV